MIQIRRWSNRNQKDEFWLLKIGEEFCFDTKKQMEIILNKILEFKEEYGNKFQSINLKGGNK